MKKIFLSMLTLVAFATGTSSYAAEVSPSRQVVEKATSLSAVQEHASIDENGDTILVRIPALGALLKPRIIASLLGADDLLVEAVRDAKTQRAMDSLFAKVDAAAVEYDVAVDSLLEGALVVLITGPSSSLIEVLVPADSRYDSYFTMTILINAASQHIDIEEGFQDHP